CSLIVLTRWGRWRLASVSLRQITAALPARLPGGSHTVHTSKLVRLTAVSAIAALALSACSDSGSTDSGANSDSSASSAASDSNGSDSESSNPADESQSPVTIEHALGETVIETKPERVATVG